MKFKYLSAAFTGLILSASCLVNVANAGLIEADINGDGTNKGFTIENSGLEWMDFGINTGFSITQIEAKLTSGGAYDGWRLATQSEVGDTFMGMFNIAGVDTWVPDWKSSEDPSMWYASDANAPQSAWESIWATIGYNTFHGTHNNVVGMFKIDGQAGAGYVGLTNYFQGHVDTAYFYTGSNLTVNSSHEQYSTMLVRDVAIVSDPNGGTTDVPEPSTFAIFALGMVGLASRRFKKQS